MKTFVMTDGAAGEIVLGSNAVRVKVEPGVPFDVPDDEAKRFTRDANFVEVVPDAPDASETRKGKATK